MGVRQVKTTSYHSQSNVTDHWNRDVKPLLGAYAQAHNDWDEHLDAISFAPRTSENRSTGFTPTFLMFGRDLQTPTDTILSKWTDSAGARTPIADYARRLRNRLANAMIEANRNRAGARASQKASYDRAHRDMEFQMGDLVLKHNHTLSGVSAGFAAGLPPKWVGPFEVAEKLSRLNYKLRDLNTGRISGPIHVGELKRYFRREGTVEAAAPAPRTRGRASECPSTPMAHPYNTRSRQNRL
ncbi:uncharacterized protein LOC119439896 [Dermacentor silvarum]|uniref:uncharacterized protein LOC119439896 n=1 Tax=Dermacentor silvarum TaxID=543639 RepID=UPI00189BA1C2|nr:uncharacterized protein LOC119439896 [Dermacentor silvarum]